MRFLKRINDENETARIVSILESRGIPCFVRSERLSLYRVALYVYLNSQYDDACALLQNSNHVVKHPVDVEEFNQALANQDYLPLLKYSVVILIVLGSLFCAVVYFY